MKVDASRSFLVYHNGEVGSPERFIESFMKAGTKIGKGRGEIRLFRAGGPMLAARRYVHGGIFRIVTSDVYLTPRRAVREFQILNLLEEKGVHVVHPICALATRSFPFKKLFLVTVFDEDGRDLVEAAMTLSGRSRLKLARDLARLVWHLLSAGVYHPDLHLRNVLVKSQGSLVLLDFDKAKVKAIGEKEMKRLVWRLYRYTEKLERSGVLTISPQERMIFLRAFSKASGYAIIEPLEKELGRRRAAFKFGWFLESLLYGGASPTAGGPRTTPRAGGGSTTPGRR
jgi:hypothetical protein